MKVRNIWRKLIAWLAYASVRKHRTKVVVFYGWDWTELLREASYELLADTVNVRRNTQWIRWDLGFPLFVLGGNYNQDMSKLRLAWTIIRAFFSLLLPRRHDHYLLASLYAKRPETLDYWLKSLPLTAVVVLPNRLELNADLSNYAWQSHAHKEGFKLLTYDEGKLPELTKQEAENLNPLQQQLLQYILLLDKSVFAELSLKFDKSDLTYAVVRLDWQAYMLSRIKTNLLAEHRDEAGPKSS